MSSLPTNQSHDANTYHKKGILALNEGDYHTALDSIKKAIELNPIEPSYFNNIAIVYCQMHHIDEAIDSLKTAIQLDPSNVEFKINLSNLYLSAMQLESSLALINDAAQQKPNDLRIQSILKNIICSSYYEKGLCAFNHRLWEQAYSYFYKILLINYKATSALCGLASIAIHQQKLLKGLTFLNHALMINPEDHESRLLKATTLLQLGDLENGWPFYESRIYSSKFTTSSRTFTIPCWQGPSTSNCTTLFIWAEQGVGDQIAFAQILHELEQLNYPVIIDCDTRLKTLFQRSFPFITFEDKPFNPSSTPGISHQIPMGSLFQYFRTTREAFQKTKRPYLIDNSNINQDFIEMIKKTDQFNIGISWRSSHPDESSEYSIPLALFMSIFTPQDNINLYCLQYANAQPEVQQWNQDHSMNIASLPWLDIDNDFDSLSTVIANLDLVISIDNMIAHLSGALNTPVFTLIPFKSDFKWPLNETQSEWYPSMTLFRQGKLGYWETALEDLKSSLKIYVQQSLTHRLAKVGYDDDRLTPA